LGEVDVLDMGAQLNGEPVIIKRKRLSKEAGTMLVLGRSRMSIL